MIGGMCCMLWALGHWAGEDCVHCAFLEGKRSVVCPCCMYPDFGESVKLVLALVGKCAVASSFSVIYLYSAELFPTEVRYIMEATQLAMCDVHIKGIYIC